MSFRLSHIHDYDRFIAIDLGAYRARAALYSLKEGQIILEGSASVRQNRKSFQWGSIADMQGIALALERAIHEACKWAEKIPDDIILGFSPEVCIYDSITTQYLRSDPEAPISMQEIDTMIQRIEYDSHVRAKEKAKHQYGIHTDDIRLLSSTLTSILIDEKVTTNPIGFSGRAIRITVLNIFSTSTEFNMLRSIVSSLGKRIISLIPMPLLLPKAIEASERSHESNLYIDIGTAHTTILSEKENQILHFESFALGSRMLFDMIASAFPEAPFIEIEGILSGSIDPGADRVTYEAIYGDYVDYILDVFLSVIASELVAQNISNIIVSGGIFNSVWLSEIFHTKLKQAYTKKFRFLPIASLLPETDWKKPFYTTHALSLLARELLLIKKDPVIRILRYVLYNYD